MSQQEECDFNKSAVAAMGAVGSLKGSLVSMNAAEVFFTYQLLTALCMDFMGSMQGQKVGMTQELLDRVKPGFKEHVASKVAAAQA